MKTCISVLVLLVSFNLIAKEPIKKKFIYKVKIDAKTRKARSKLANYLHLDEINKDNVIVYVRGPQFEMIKLNNEPETFKVLKKTALNGKSKSLRDEVEFPEGDEEFHTYKEVIDKLNQIAKDNPETVELINIGKSHEKRDLLGVKISAGGFENEMDKPALMLIGSHHAREHLSTEVPILLLDYFMSEMKSNRDFKKLMMNRVVYVVPLLNPDGAIHDLKDGEYQLWRKNRRKNKGFFTTWGVDLNRNYGYGWGTGGSSSWPNSDVYKGKSAFSEPETQAVKKFVEEHKNLKTMLSFHTYSELILYPWGGKNEDVGGKEQKVFETMAQKMATWNNYKPQKSSDLYIASGDTCDWAFGEHKIFCFTFELSPKGSLGAGGAGFYPGAQAIQKTYKANIKPVMYLLENTADPYGVLAEEQK